MNDLLIIDNYVDEREFRNYINSLLIKKGYEKVTIEDPRIADLDKLNDNDIMVKKGNIYYTVGVYLNEDIDSKHIVEMVEDMRKEDVPAAIIITNKEVSVDMKDYANKKMIQIWDKLELEKDINNK